MIYYFQEYSKYPVLFRQIMFTKFLNLTKIVKAVSDDIAIFWGGGDLKHIFGHRMFSSVQLSRYSEVHMHTQIHAHTHTYSQTDRKTEFQNRLYS
jgi:hypothetical protein